MEVEKPSMEVQLIQQAEQRFRLGLHISDGGANSNTGLCYGYYLAKDEALRFLEMYKTYVVTDDGGLEEGMCGLVAVGTLTAKLDRGEFIYRLAEIMVAAVNHIHKPHQPVDLSMVDLVGMRHECGDASLVGGLVLDHGFPPGMTRRVENCYILSCNMSLGLEDKESGTNAGFFYSDAQREKPVATGGRLVDESVEKIIELKNKVCGGNSKNFVVVNEKGIDPLSLDLLSRAGIVALCRENRVKIERLVLACGGKAVSSVEDLTEACLGWAGLVHEQFLGEEKHTFVEECVKNPQSSILIKGPDKHNIDHVMGAVVDGLRSLKDAIEDKAIVLGAGSFEAAAANYLKYDIRDSVTGDARRSVEAFEEELLAAPWALAEKSAHDTEDALMDLMCSHECMEFMGLDARTGDVIDPMSWGIYDGYSEKRRRLNEMVLRGV